MLLTPRMFCPRLAHTTHDSISTEVRVTPVIYFSSPDRLHRLVFVSADQQRSSSLRAVRLSSHLRTNI